MKRSFLRGAIAVFSAAALVAAPAASVAQQSAPLAPPAATAADPPPRPAPARARPDPATDEGGIWGVADRAEEDAHRSVERISDPALNAYVASIACRVAAEFCGDVRIYLMQRPFYNASMAPNGYMEVWSGLMLRVEDEAQLAFVLGHEIAHYDARHSLETLRAMRGRSNAALAASVAIAVIGAAAAANSPNSAQSIMNAAGGLIDIAYLGALASLFGYSRENEAEADAEGFRRIAAAGYDPAAPARQWRLRIDEVAASDFERTRREEARAGIFNTHPLNRDRVEALEALAQRAAAGGETGRARYRAAIRPFLDPWLRDELRRRDYGQTLFLIERLASAEEDLGVLLFYRGEAHRLRRGDGDLAHARAAYESAIQHPDAPPLAWRQLGEIYERERRAAEAAALLRAYLDRAPAASDRLLIERRIAALEAQAPPGGTP